MIKDFTLTVHHINEYLIRIWGAHTPSLTDNTGIMSDLESEYLRSTIEIRTEAPVQQVDVHSCSVYEADSCDIRSNQLNFKNTSAHNKMQHFAGNYLNIHIRAFRYEGRSVFDPDMVESRHY